MIALGQSAVNTFFMLHFGSYGGNPVRWMYLLMGLGGTLLFPPATCSG